MAAACASANTGTSARSVVDKHAAIPIPSRHQARYACLLSNMPWKLLVLPRAYLSFSLSPFPPFSSSLPSGQRQTWPIREHHIQTKACYKSPTQGAYSHKAPCLLPLPAPPHHPPPTRTQAASIWCVVVCACACACVCLRACVTRPRVYLYQSPNSRSTTITSFAIHHQPTHYPLAEGVERPQSTLMSADIRTALNCLRHPSRFMGISRTQLSRVHTGDSIQNISKPSSKCVPGSHTPREPMLPNQTRPPVLDNRQ